MNYQEACEYQEVLETYGDMPDAERIGRLCKAMKLPLEQLRVIRLIGTEEYGAFGGYLASILKRAGVRVGRCFLPEYDGIRERTHSNGLAMAELAFCRGMEYIREACKVICNEGEQHPSAADAEAALAVWFFCEKNCSIVLAEEYGEQKAQWRALSEALAGQCVQVLELEALAKKGSVPAKVRIGKKCLQFSYESYENLETGIMGRDRIGEAILAIEAAGCLDGLIPGPGEAVVRKGISEAVWPGHFEKIADKPTVIIDCAQDVRAVRELMELITGHFTGKQPVFVMGMKRNTAYEKMIEISHGYAGQILTVTLSGEKDCLSAYELASLIYRSHEQVTAVDSPEEALEIGRLIAGKDGVIVAFGSPSLAWKLAAANKSGLNTLEKKRHTNR